MLLVRNVKGILERQWNKKKKLCDNVEVVREFTYPGDSVSAFVECEVAVAAGTKCGWVRIRVCGELLYVKIFPLVGLFTKAMLGQQYCMEVKRGV